ncbi:MAG: hypothetical protein OER87_18225, partial [Gammaproteobacteria bacterium]|nr:hypothetical protein [Gammaproteobacteria bacterium]
MDGRRDRRDMIPVDESLGDCRRGGDGFFGNDSGGDGNQPDQQNQDDENGAHSETQQFQALQQELFYFHFGSAHERKTAL